MVISCNGVQDFSHVLLKVVSYTFGASKTVSCISLWKAMYCTGPMSLLFRVSKNSDRISMAQERIIKRSCPT